jgi:hypothetical protein
MVNFFAIDQAPGRLHVSVISDSHDDEYEHNREPSGILRRKKDEIGGACGAHGGGEGCIQHFGWDA